MKENKDSNIFLKQKTPEHKVAHEGNRTNNYVFLFPFFTFVVFFVNAFDHCEKTETLDVWKKTVHNG